MFLITFRLNVNLLSLAYKTTFDLTLPMTLTLSPDSLPLFIHCSPTDIFHVP